MNRIESLFKEWQSLQPVKKEYQQRLDQKFMLEFNYNSNHIEGNTLTYGQTEMLLMFGKVVDEANMKDLEEMKASNVGLKMVKEMALDKEQPLTEYFIRTLHKTLLREDYTVYRQRPDGTNTSYVVHAGVYKTRPNSVITVTGERFEYASPEETPALMTDLLQWYHQAEKEGTMKPIELASLFHYRYIRIHPFEDGNGRISRLMVNYILYRHGYPMIVVKSADKENYLTALNRCDVAIGPVPSDGAHAELSQIAPFVEYMSRCLERALEIGIRGAKGERIEEDDDWRKNLKTKYRDKINLPQATTEVVKKLIDQDFKVLVKQTSSELSEFYSLFTSVKEESICTESNSERAISYKDIFFSKDFGAYHSEFTISISILCRQFEYTIGVIARYQQNLPDLLFQERKNYSENITEKDISNTINHIGNFFNDFIETKGFVTNKKR